MEKSSKPAYGGQAIVEGVMFGGKHTTVSMIRRKDGSLDSFEVERQSPAWVTKAKKIPFVRGIAGIIEASINGSKHLNFSSDRYDVDPSEDDSIKPTEKSSKLNLILGVAAVAVLSFLFSKLVFTLVPAFLANLFTPILPGHVAQNLLEGGFKLILLLGYLYLLSFTPLIRRVFQYHGAEHKVINAYEAGQPLTVQSVQASSRLHYRCGSSFILFTVIVGVGLYLFLPFDSLMERILQRIVLIPVVLGISYEVLQLTNRFRDIPVLKWLGYPGLALQLLTTKEPNDEQTEVAIASFNEMLTREQSYTSSAKADIV
ncbi:DUF1385 domain-containing protein [Alkalicoccobacillus gibsonii]|jgi:uncharacterized protein YqhQ|uniref:DUF1385 domain-containing protein n=1 Tax=Alkalicoccobacillus gibsonii TaxID=79881 RepID=A0ABU9VKH0_9BACI